MCSCSASVSSAVFSCELVGTDFLSNGNNGFTQLLLPRPKKAHRRAVSAECPGVDVAGPAMHASRVAALREPGVHESAEILVPALGTQPEAVQLVVDLARHFERAPD